MTFITSADRLGELAQTKRLGSKRTCDSEPQRSQGSPSVVEGQFSILFDDLFRVLCVLGGLIRLPV